MALLRGQVTFANRLQRDPFDEWIIRLEVPLFEYRPKVRGGSNLDEDDNTDIEKIKIGERVFETYLDSEDFSFEVEVPGETVLGSSLSNYGLWTKGVNWDDLSLDIKYKIASSDRTVIEQGILRLFYDTDDRPETGPGGNFYSRLFFVNASAYLEYLEKFPARRNDSDNYGLKILRALGVFTSKIIRLDTIDDNVISGISSTFAIGDNTIKALIESFEELTSFPINVPLLREINIGGTFNINGKETLPYKEKKYYHIGAETSIETLDDNQISVLESDSKRLI